MKPICQLLNTGGLRLKGYNSRAQTRKDRRSLSDVCAQVKDRRILAYELRIEAPALGLPLGFHALRTESRAKIG